ncbi:SDR family NAD(P)-dependent oxidoreductase [Neobacillus rhizophilus]|uniref:SDR family NAD(P)-dependent oxidoreductase n=1 Tax=Neobacillus rhizophilus TaxID=2833579 RepID=A0A942U454_9BACI|nr:SDR family NAD(P)-dependent oxidoreductase [Neobacillus rhizophilus]MBS4214371.1 SDR family NAD(P)-dependent oxidoreductase [Neobacillus rhizophilus]
MKKALVLGATGGMGYALVRELGNRGVEVVAFSRGKEKLHALYQHEPRVTIFPGDALVEKDVIEAADGVDVIFHAVSFPYPEWEEKHPLCIEIIVRAAEIHHAKIALVDNIYAYGRQSKIEVNEDTKKEPHTKKGNIRLAMENRLKGSGIPSLIVHLPDVYGPNAENTILHETLKNVVQHKTANFVGDLKVAREYIFTLDAAKAMVELASREDTYNQNWNIPSAHQITGEEIIEILRKDAGYKKPIRTVSKTMIRFIGIFHPFMRELVEMMYLTEDPVILSGKKYEAKIGPVPRTPYQEGIKKTLHWMQQEDVGFKIKT